MIFGLKIIFLIPIYYYIWMTQEVKKKLMFTNSFFFFLMSQFKSTRYKTTNKVSNKANTKDKLLFLKYKKSTTLSLLSIFT